MRAGATRAGAAAVVIAAALAACGPKRAPQGPSPSDALVMVTSNVRDAQVYIDGKLVGPADILRHGIAMDPGKHLLELRHDDYFSRYVVLDLHRAEHRTLQLDLAPVLP